MSKILLRRNQYEQMMSEAADRLGRARDINAELLAFVRSYVTRFGARHADEVDSELVKQARALIAKAQGV